jgi:hypothetical protein
MAISNKGFSNLENGYLELISKLFESRWGVRGGGGMGMIRGDAMIPFSRSRFEIPVFQINI